MSDELIDPSLRLYAVKDKISQSIVCVFAALSDGVAVRDNLPALSRAYPVKDLDLLHVGYIGREDFTVSALHTPSLVPWTCYEFPQVPHENLAAGKTVDEAQQSFDKNTSDVVK